MVHPSADGINYPSDDGGSIADVVFIRKPDQVAAGGCPFSYLYPAPSIIFKPYPTPACTAFTPKANSCNNSFAPNALMRPIMEPFQWGSRANDLTRPGLYG